MDLFWPCYVLLILTPDTVFAAPSIQHCVDYIHNCHGSAPVVFFINLPSNLSTVDVFRQFQRSSRSPIVLPIALVDDEDSEMTRLIALGAVDVMNKEIDSARLKSVFVQAHRSLQSASSGVPRSGWVSGRTYPSRISTAEEDLVASLFDEMFFDMSIEVSSMETKRSEDRKRYLQSVVAQWDFPANLLSDDDLAQCAYLIFEHAFKMPEVSALVLSPVDLQAFLMVLQRTYQPRNPYHNFRHAVDVLQATFCFLLAIGIIPSYPYGTEWSPKVQSKNCECAVENVFTSGDALVLLVAAIGHDVGHPGVTNAFLISVRSPLARMYNDRSVLESFHCAAFSQILSKYWPVMQQKEMKESILEAVLATDMAVHFEYMKKLDNLGEQVASADKPANNTKLKHLVGSLLMKCADISNVARRFDISTHWGEVLGVEFKNMADLEVSLGLKPAAPPSTDAPRVALAKGQIFFIDSFAYPLFSAMSKGIPELQFAADEVHKNKQLWEAELVALS
ncbi:uncharacterized protein V1516DRAFT_625760 [Lipomyces oligophaga]|uniref:uncharacterized protein n=1 Tax=Lipomyces oligophaga TaxID=45792 RepID=UPI0034CF5566